MKEKIKEIAKVLVVATLGLALVGCKENKKEQTDNGNVMGVYAEEIKKWLDENDDRFIGIRGGQLGDVNNDGVDDVYVAFQEDEGKTEILFVKAGDSVKIIYGQDDPDVYKDKSGNSYVVVKGFETNRYGNEMHAFCFDKKGKYKEQLDFDSYVDFREYAEENGVEQVDIEFGEYVYLKKDTSECSKEVIEEWLKGMK